MRLDGRNWYIEEIMPRKGCLTRTSPLGKKQVLAANIDLVAVVASIKSPPLRRGFLDRALASAVWNGIPAAIVLNKMDLAGDEDAADVGELKRIYEGLAGFRTVTASTVTGEGIDDFRRLIAEKTVALAGISAAGKTSLVKVVNPDIELKVGAVNVKTTKGRHTTVSARLIPLWKDTFLMDTPGLRAFSVDHIPSEDLKDCFPDFRDFEGCRYRNCLHDSEPGCGVREAVEKGDIDRERYGSYLKLLKEDNSQ